MKKVIVISGGSDGLGREIAKQLTAEHTVIILSPDKEELQGVADTLKCDFRVCDVSDPKNIALTVNSIRDEYNSIDCLINNAGIWIEGALDQNDVTNIQAVITINATGAILLTKAILPVMKEQKDGLIINVVSQAGIYAKAERSIYTASKWALTGFTKSLQAELAKNGIRVTGLYPGKMKTKMFEKLGIKKSMEDALETKEVARVVAFLISSNRDVVFPEIGIKHINN